MFGYSRSYTPRVIINLFYLDNVTIDGILSMNETLSSYLIVQIYVE
jgi:hypothetical protein